ncbi:MAG TPA: WG repeat-containing protein [Brumimicrobium sp.]|nr:WG repeat-containing protein [Brumimicrobium sp.]
MINTKYFIFILLGSFMLMLGACKVNKGFEALEQYNYFEAKKQFEKSLKKQKSPSAYGLSIIYFRNDNPFYNLDSAYHYGLLSVESFSDTKAKNQDKWAEKLGYTLAKAKQQRKLISDLAYHKANQQNTPEGYQYFIVNYPWSINIELAEKKRDSLAFLNAKNVNSSVVLADYIHKYAESDWVQEAQSLLYRAQFDETVKLDQTESYMEFIRRFPDNPLVRDAQFQVFSIETKENTILAYNKFIKRFPNNPFIDEAWTSLYRLSVADYKKENIKQFAIDYPHFPFPNLIEQDLQLVGQTLFQFIRNGKYGFMNENGEVMISPSFEYASQFKNGLAVVIQDEKYGYINKNGEVMIQYQFEEALDFDHGRAIVVVNDKYGLIDVSGNYILQPKFEDIGSFSEGLTYVQDEKGYQYYTLDGSIAFSAVFKEAFSFNAGLAQVKTGDKKGFITTNGSFVCSVSVGNLRHFKDSLFVHEFRDSMSLMYANGNYLPEKSFDQIGVLSDNRAIVEKDGAYGYINGKGEVLIPIKYVPFSNYMQFAQFENQHVVYKKGQKYAMMDSLGKSILPALFDGIGVFGELIPITKGKGWGYSSKDVRLKINYQFDYAYEFIKGTAVVEKDNLFGLINLNAEEIIPFEYESIKRLDKGVLLVKSNNFFGLLTDKGDTLVKPQYDRVNEVSKNLFQLIKGQTIAYYDVSKNRLIALKE